MIRSQTVRAWRALLGLALVPACLGGCAHFWEGPEGPLDVTALDPSPARSPRAQDRAIARGEIVTARHTGTPARRPTEATADPALRRTRAVPDDAPQPPDGPDAPSALPLPGPSPLAGTPAGDLGAEPLVSDLALGQSMGLETALGGALTGNPDLVALRQNAPATWEAVEVARLFPITLNPTLWINYRPLNYAPIPGQHRYDQKDGWINTSLRQPIEFGNQTRYRHAIALAAHDQARWNIVQAEVLALVQTYRFFQTAAYRREKLKLAGKLAQFNARLVESLRKASEENLVPVADVRVAEVELSALRQQVSVAKQDYAIALADLRTQIGAPETAATAEPLGEFVMPAYIPPLEDAHLVSMALQTRPEIHAAKAAATGALAAVKLANGDRIPTIVAGPEYQRDEVGIHYLGFVFAAPLPTLNNGMPLVRQREAEYRRACVAVKQVEQRTVAQVRVAVAKYNAAQELVRATAAATGELENQVNGLETLFQENRIDLGKLLQARQRLIQLENARLDATWQATQAQADLLTALGAPNLLEMTRPQGPGPNTHAARNP